MVVCLIGLCLWCVLCYRLTHSLPAASTNIKMSSKQRPWFLWTRCPSGISVWPLPPQPAAFREQDWAWDSTGWRVKWGRRPHFFCYETFTFSFITLLGVTAATSSGEWTQPESKYIKWINLLLIFHIESKVIDGAVQGDWFSSMTGIYSSLCFIVSSLNSNCRYLKWWNLYFITSWIFGMFFNSGYLHWITDICSYPV